MADRPVGWGERKAKPKRKSTRDRAWVPRAAPAQPLEVPDHHEITFPITVSVDAVAWAAEHGVVDEGRGLADAVLEALPDWFLEEVMERVHSGEWENVRKVWLGDG